MFLSNVSLHDAAKYSNLWTPYVPENVQPCSVDFTLDYVDTPFMEYDYSHESGDGIPVYAVKPNQHCLAVTRERVCIPDYLGARVEGKSSLGRMGLFVHITAGWIDAGFEGNITLELFNCSDEIIYLPYGRKICQLAVFMLDRPANPAYNGKYQGAKGLEYNKEPTIHG
jgi:dCTP deaminase